MKRGIVLAVATALISASGFAAQVPVGYLSWDVNFPGNAGQFDIVNLTGPNAAPPTFPITTLVKLSSLSLTVQFVGGGTTIEPASYFTIGPDGESFNGTAIPIGGTNPRPTSATLSGLFTPTSINVSGMGVVNINSSFTVTFSDTPNLVDGDLGIIYATTTTTGVPEPDTWMLLSFGLVGLIVAKNRFFVGSKAALNKRSLSMRTIALPISCFIVAHSAFGQLSLPPYTSPSTGVAGVNNVNITVSNVPAGTVTPANVVVNFATSCAGVVVATEAANSVKGVLGSTDRFNINLPGSLITGNYFVTLSDSALGDANFTSGNCSAVQVTASAPVLNACLAGSSMGILLPSGGATGNVTAYTPKGYWSGGTTGVFVKNIEGTLGAGSTITTPRVPNSCSSNPATGQTVCVANNTDVYLITGTTLNTVLTSGSNALTSFSGGSCNNCGVALNGNNNTATINMGLTGAGSGSGVQILNLNTNTFSAALPTNQEVSENISVDPTRSLILSSNESGNLMILQIQSNGALKEFASSFNNGLTNDASAEDCSTGIAIAPGEFSTGSVALINLNSITFGATTYTAPNATAVLNVKSYGLAAGPSGAAVAQGSGHLAVIEGEFGGNTFAVLKLPSASSSATPALVDHVLAQIPSSTQCGGTFSAGFDPHTVTAYTSPNDGNSYAVFAGYSGGVPVCLAKVNMTTLINPTLAPRGGGVYSTNEISPANFPASAVTFFSLP